MIYERDWLMRQIEMLGQLLEAYIRPSKCGNLKYCEALQATSGDLKYKDLFYLVQRGKLNEAENLLFDLAEWDNLTYFAMGIELYRKMAELSDFELEKNGFSREEIVEGLKDFSKGFNIPGVDILIDGI